MKNFYRIAGFFPYFLIVFFNATIDLGHKIILQNTIFKSFEGTELMVLTAIINALILLPFVFLFSPSGFINDKYAKVKVVQVLSFSAIIITILITISYYLGYFEVAFFATLLLAAQSALYSPAKYGLIKEMFGEEHLVRANSLVQSITIIAILLGAVIYSVFFEYFLPAGISDKSEILQYIAPIGFILIFSSILDFFLSLKLVNTQEEKKEERFSLSKYLRGQYFKKNNILIKRKKDIFHSVIGLGILWAISQTVVAVFGQFLKSSLQIENTIVVNLLLVVMGGGVVVGSIIVSRLFKNRIQMGIVPVGSFGLFLSLLVIVNLNDLYMMGVMFFFYGISTSLIVVPLNSIIQFNSSRIHLGRILATSNFYQNMMMLTALFVVAFLSYKGLDSKQMLLISAIFALFGLFWSLIKLPQSFIIFIGRIILRFFYKFDVSGLENIPKNKGVLLLGNHVSYIDWLIVQFAYPEQVSFVMEKGFYDKWYLQWFCKIFQVIPITSGNSKSSLKKIEYVLSEGKTVVLFPEGMVTRNSLMNDFYSGYELAVKGAKNTVIMPFYFHGLWGSKFSYGKSTKKKFRRELFIKFGRPLSSDTKTEKLKKEIIGLSVDIWNRYSELQENITRTWMDSIKSNSNFFAADSTGLKLSNYKFLAGTLIMRKYFKKSIKSGENVGLILPSSVAGALANMALLSLGNIVCNLNYTTGEQPLKVAMNNANIKTIVTSRKFVQKLKSKSFKFDGALTGCHIVYLEDMKSSVYKLQLLVYYLRARFYPKFLLKLLFTPKKNMDDTAAILFSSGSEANPKGIMLSHKNIIANINQTHTLINYNDDDRIMGSLPIFHSFGFTVCTLLPIVKGIPIIYHFDPTDGYTIGKLIAKYRATAIFGTSTFFRLYACNRKIHPLMLDTIRLVIAGAEKLSINVRDEFKKKFGLEIYEGYGATETSPVASCNVPDTPMFDFKKIQIRHKYNTVGKPLIGTKIIVVDPDTFEELDLGKEGMILISGPQVMKGYLNDSKKTNQVIKEIDSRRYYVTGDKGKIDQDNFITIIDRYSRFAKIAGEMISLSRCEQQIQSCLDSTIEIVASNVPDTRKGEKIVLLVSGDIDLKELKNILIEAKIHSLYLPSSYHKVDSIPKLVTGKVDLKNAKKVIQKLEGKND